MTENEAKTKWCPFARLHCEGLSYGAANRSYKGKPTEGARCVGSDCMAWRGSETVSFKARADGEFQRSGRRITPGAHEREGFCGLAGRPT